VVPIQGKKENRCGRNTASLLIPPARKRLTEDGWLLGTHFL
jgi:hypothetical protein